MIISSWVYIDAGFISELIALVFVPIKAREEPCENPADNPSSPHEWVLKQALDPTNGPELRTSTSLLIIVNIYGVSQALKCLAPDNRLAKRRRSIFAPSSWVWGGWTLFGTNTSAMSSKTKLASSYTHKLISISILVPNTLNWLHYRLFSEGLSLFFWSPS